MASGTLPPTSPGTAAAANQLTESGDLRLTWESWRKGGVISCRGDGAPVALAVDGTVSTYRFICTECGNSSPWFEASPRGLVVRDALGESGQTGMTEK